MRFRFFTSLALGSSAAALFAGTASAQLTHAWSADYGDVFSQAPAAMTTTPSGDLLLTGTFRSTIDFGGGPLTSSGLADIFLARLDANGAHVWSRRYGGTDDQIPQAVARDAAGNLFLAGQFRGNVSFGGGTLVANGGVDVFVVKLTSTGLHLWSQRFGDSNLQYGRGLGVDPAGDVLVAGEFSGSLDFGGGLLTSAGLSDVYIVKFDSGGTHLWSQRFGDGGQQEVRGATVDSSGNLLVTGFVNGTVDFGGGPLTGVDDDVFLAKFDGSGAHVWSQRHGGTNTQVGWSVATDADDDVYVAGHFLGDLDLGGGVLTSAGATDVFVAKFDPSGAHQWSRSFGDAGSQVAPHVATDDAGRVALTGSFDGSLDFGGGPIASAGSSDVFLAQLDPAGGHVWSAGFGDASAQAGLTLAFDGLGSLFSAGQFTGLIDFGGGNLVEVGVGDVYVVKHDGAGTSPSTYCTAKTSSAGCVAAIATSDGTAQPVSGAADYFVEAGQVQEIKNGLLFAGIAGPASLPFNGGTLCVQPPTKRGPITNSGGDDPLECDGAFSTLVNDGQVVPLGLDAGAGNSAWYQYWFRDPANGPGQLGTSLSDAVALDFQ